MRKVALAEIGGRGSFTANRRFTPHQAEDVVRDPVAQAFDAGYAEGERAARAAAEARYQTAVNERAAIELAFARFDEASAKLLKERMRSAVAVVCQAMAGDIALDTAGLAARVEAAAAMLRRRHDERFVLLNPADIALVRDRIDPNLRIEADPSLPRGALRVEMEDGGVEDGAEQWRMALAEALGTCTP